MKSRRNKFIYSIIAIIAACLVITWFFIIPNIEAIIKINRDISSQRLDLEKKAALGLNIKQITADIADVTKNIKQLDQMIVKQGDELEFLSILDGLAQKNNINSQAIPQFSDKEIRKLTKIPLEISASGEYDNLMTYWHDLESMPYYYNIESVELQGAEAKAMSLHLIGSIYINP